MVHGPRAILHALPNWDDFRHFLAVARAGTLAGAARDLKVEHTTVGRRLAALERALGTRLFTRSPDGFALTRAGQDILPLADEMLEKVDGILRRVSGEDERVTGTVRVTTSESLSGYLVRHFAEFRLRHPELMVEVLSGNRAFDLMRGEADLAVRVRLDSEPDLIARKIAVAAWALYASPTYLERKGAPKGPGDLAGADVIGFDASLASVPGAVWIAEHGKAARFVMRANSIVAAMNATLVGMGIGALPCFAADGEPGLKKLGPGTIGERDVFVVVHPDLARVARVRVVMDFVVEVFRRDAGLWDGTAPKDPGRGEP
jgi:DNA-binding transcriptional LysR family regulator